MSELVRLERDDDGIALLSLQDPVERNTFHPAFLDQLLGSLATLAADDRVKVCVVRGLPEVFCGGAHRDLLLELAGTEMSPGDIVLPRLILDLPIPTIAAMEGHAVGGGLALGLCCDLVLLARESRYGCSFMNLGFTPGMGTTRLLERAVGEYVAAEMMFGGQMFKGSHFERCGGINYVLPRAAVLPRAMDLARRIAEKPRFALELLKRHLSLPRRQAFEEARTSEAALHQLCFARPEVAERIRAEYVQAAPPAAPASVKAPTGAGGGVDSPPRK